MHTTQKSLYLVMVPTLTSGPSSYLQTHWFHPDAKIPIWRRQSGSCCCGCSSRVLSRTQWTPQCLCHVLLLNLVFILLWIPWSSDYFTTSEETQTSFFCNLISFRSKTLLCFQFHLTFLVSFHLDFIRPTARNHFSFILWDLGLCWIQTSFSLSQFLP